MKITYDSHYKKEIVKALGLEKANVDLQKAVLVDNVSKEPIKNDDGELITFKNFGGLQKASVHYYRNDLPSMIALSKKLKQR